MFAKNCKKHGYLTVNEVHAGNRCKYCRIEQTRKSSQKHAEKVALRKKQYFERNKEKAYASAAKYRKTQKYKKVLKELRKKQRIEMDDYYIKRLITRFYKLTKEDISQDLIDLMKANLKLKRKLKLTKPIGETESV